MVFLKWSIRRPRVQVPRWPPAGFVLGSREFKSSTTLVNSQLVCLRSLGILHPFMFGLIICFKNLLGPTNISVLNTAEGKKQKFLILNFLFIRRHFDLSWNVAFLQQVQKVTSVDCNWLISIHVVNLVSWYLWLTSNWSTLSWWPWLLPNFIPRRNLALLDFPGFF